jgi:hypothetical protein
MVELVQPIHIQVLQSLMQAVVVVAVDATLLATHYKQAAQAEQVVVVTEQQMLELRVLEQQTLAARAAVDRTSMVQLLPVLMAVLVLSLFVTQTQTLI